MKLNLVFHKSLPQPTAKHAATETRDCMLTTVQLYKGFCTTETYNALLFTYCTVKTTELYFVKKTKKRMKKNPRTADN